MFQLHPKKFWPQQSGGVGKCCHSKCDDRLFFIDRLEPDRRKWTFRHCQVVEGQAFGDGDLCNSDPTKPRRFESVAQSTKLKVHCSLVSYNILKLLEASEKICCFSTKGLCCTSEVKRFATSPQCQCGTMRPSRRRGWSGWLFSEMQGNFTKIGRCFGKEPGLEIWTMLPFDHPFPWKKPISQQHLTIPTSFQRMLSRRRFAGRNLPPPGFRERWHQLLPQGGRSTKVLPGTLEA